MTLGAIKDDLLNKSLVAVDHALDAIENDLHMEIGNYYGDYSPKRYRRTRKLNQTPKIFQPAAITGSGAEGTIGLNLGIGYSTGMWSMAQVVDSAEAGLHGGYPYGGGVPFWSEASYMMQSRLDEGCSAAGF